MTDTEALLTERAALLARLAQIDAQLAGRMTTPQVAEHLGIGVRSVRTVTARMGVEPVGRGADGNIYDRAAILAAAAKRPGAGARTDLRKDEQA